MLSYNNRLIKRKDFERARKLGIFSFHGCIALRVLKNGLSETRIGFVAGIKFSKKAVDRNLVKRRLREIFYTQLQYLRKGLDIVVMVRKNGKENISYDQLKWNVEQTLKNYKLIS